MARTFGSLALVAVIAVVGFVFRDRLSANAGELRVGDCYDEPAGLTDTIDDVQHHPCSEAHQFEVILVADHPAAKGDAYPTDDELEDWVGSQCVPAFTAYTGESIDSPAIALGYYSPTPDGWEGGDRKVICYVGRTDGSTVSQSFKAATAP